jgi:histidine phosphotransferase ChpT
MLITLNLVGVTQFAVYRPCICRESSQTGRMLIDTASLVALVSSRICHDLVSPVAALTTALDILDDDHGAEMREQAMELIRNSAAQASVKLEFLRAAFGAGTIGSGDYDLSETKILAERFFATQKPELVWTLALTSVPRPGARLLMNLLLVGLDCLPRGGRLEVNGGYEGDKLTLSFLATGTRATLKPAVRAGLAGEMPEGGFDGRSIQPYLAFLAASGARAELAARESDERIEIIVRFVTA